MKIGSYVVNTSAERSYQKVEYQSVTAEVWGGGGLQTLNQQASGDTVSLSDTAKNLLLEQAKESNASLQLAQDLRAGGAITSVTGRSDAAQSPQEAKLRLLQEMVYALTGRRTHFRIGELYKRPEQPQLSFAGLRGGVGGEITATRFSSEKESVSYQAKGLIQTQDGKSIAVDVSLHMSREFVEYSSATLNFGASRPTLCDPLVINYAGDVAALTNEKFEFDLDFDGELDNISFAGPGSGFLALDKNGDGRINDGRELFGPNTGNGFEELRQYDQDGNGWIDENDGIFQQLRIWSKDANGNDQMFSLLEVGVGAIYLGDVETQFSMNDDANNTQGVMRSTSFFLKENGGAGTVHHIDLVV